MKKTLLFLLSLEISAVIFAQVPQALNYQAIARNPDGSIVSGQTIGVRFSILAESPTGTTLYSETQQATTNNFGLFTLALGKGTVVLGTFSGINWGTGSKFLKVEIAPQGGINFQLQGTTQLLSVPYALYAEKSGTTGSQGPPGVNGLSILNGIINPTTTIGVDGDFYINKATYQLFGPKTNGSWNAGTSLTGAAGPPGEQGAMGETGLQGSAGPAGSQGSIGLTGGTGPAGSQGPIGLTGATGPAGSQGPIGLTGAIGSAGPQGAMGTTGPAGFQGATGATGATGSMGVVGATGPQGPAGGPTGPPGLKSLIDLVNFSGNPICLLGGVIVRSGIDQNNNNILDVNEIDNTKTICFNQSAPLDKVIILPIFYSSGSTTSTIPYITGELRKFNKSNYPQVDSIILVAGPYVVDARNTSIVELYNSTDSLPISNSKITTHNLYSYGQFQQTGNLFNSLPTHDITLGIRWASGTSGMLAGTGNCYLYLYRK